MKNNSKINGFTVVELLAVVAIVGLVLAVALPAMGRAQAYSKRLDCLAYLQTTNTAVMTYSTEHRGYAPVVPVFGSPDSVSDAYARLEFSGSRAYLQASYFSQSAWFVWMLASASGGQLDLYTCPSQPDSSELEDNEWFRFNGQDIRLSSYTMTRAFLADPIIYSNQEMARVGHLKSRRIAQTMHPSAKAVVFETRLYHQLEWQASELGREDLPVPVAFADGHAEFVDMQDVSQGELARNTGRSPKKLFDTPRGVLGRDLR